MQRIFSYFAISLALSACYSIQTMEPINPALVQDGISPVAALPETLPGGMTQFENSHYVFVHADNASTLAVGLVVPIPFVTEAVVNASNRSAAKDGNQHYLDVDVYEIFLEEMRAHPNYTEVGGLNPLHMLVVLEESYDDVHRFSIMLQLESEGWVGRYYYHLSTLLPSDDFREPTLEELDIFAEEFAEGVKLLLAIIDRDVNGEFSQPGEPITVGSLYIVGGRIGGLVNPTTFAVRNSELLYEDENGLIVRIPGDLNAAANSGGMAYGIHYFTPEQLHTFIRQDSDVD